MSGVARARGALGPLDALRRSWLRALGPAARPLLREPELRGALLGVLAVAGALLGTLLVPLWLLAVSPLVLGVPHLLADVRYLVARPGLHRRPLLVVGVGAPLLAAGLGLGMRAGLVAILMALVCTRGARWRQAVGAALLLAAAAWGYHDRYYTLELCLAHVHNGVGVLLWWLWRPRRRALHLLPLTLFVAAGGLLLLGAVQPLASALREVAGPEGLPWDWHREVLTPGWSPQWGLRLLLVYAYAQAVHYSVWLRLIPEEDRDRPTPRTFRASVEALRADLGAPLLAVAAAVAVGLSLWGLYDLMAARTGYFRLALFHGYLELCALSIWWVAGQHPRPLRPLPRRRAAPRLPLSPGSTES
jgi:hypothetical protein